MQEVYVICGKRREGFENELSWPACVIFDEEQAKAIVKIMNSNIRSDGFKESVSDLYYTNAKALMADDMVKRAVIFDRNVKAIDLLEGLEYFVKCVPVVDSMTICGLFAV